METNRLRQFCVIAETQNLRRAAEVLGISHGGLFKSLKVLEDELGFPLFRKAGRGIVITEQGKRFLPRAQKFLEAENDLIEKDAVNEAASLRIGTFEVFSTYFFSAVIAPDFSGAPVVLRELIPGALEEALLNYEIDLGITYEPIPMQGLQILAIAKCRMGIFGKKDRFQGMGLADIPFAAPVLPVKSVISGVKGLDGWPDDKVRRNIRYRVDMMETALQLSSRGYAVGFFPSFVVDLYNETRSKEFQLHEIVAPQVSKKRMIYLVLRASSEESGLVKKIARRIRTICGST